MPVASAMPQTATITAPQTQTPATAGNAADIWKKIASLMTVRSNETPNGIFDSFNEYGKFTQLHHSTDLSPAEMESMREILERLKPALDLAAQAAAQKNMDFGLDLMTTPERQLWGEAKVMRDTALMILHRGDMQQTDGDTQAFIDAQRVAVGIATQIGQEKEINGSILANSVACKSHERVQELIEQGEVSSIQAKELLEALKPASGHDPFNYVGTAMLAYERMETALSKDKEQGKSLQEWAETTDDGNGIHLPEGSENLTLENLSQSLQKWKPIYGMYDQAMRETDPKKAQAMIDAAEQIADSLPELDRLARPAWLAYHKYFELRIEDEQKMADLTRMLTKIGEDPLAADKFRSPANLWARVAAQTCALPKDSQIALKDGELAGTGTRRAVHQAGQQMPGEL